MRFTPYTQTVTYNAPHYRQGQLWHRYARRLRLSGAYQMKEDALKFSLQRGTRGFVFAADLTTEPRDFHGLHELERRAMKGETFPELSARISYDADADREETELLIHTNSGQRLSIGRLPEEHSTWTLPLLREGLPLRFYVAAEAIAQAGVEADASVTVVISGAPEAGREWIDILDERQERAKQRAEIIPRVAAFVTGPHENPRTGSRLTRADRPTVEDWLREDAERREIAITDLPAGDYWKVRHTI